MTNNFNFIFSNLVLILTYILLILEKLPRVVVALLGASLLLITKTIPQEEAFRCIDFNVIFLLVGMMIIVNILGETGAIKWLALFIAKSVNGSGARLMIYFGLLTALLSAMLDNVTTVLILCSVTCAITKDLKINPVPYLITEIITSNIGGTATLIGDPPNIMVGSAAKLDFLQFITNLAPVAIIILFVSMFTLYLIYKKDLNIPDSAKKELEKLSLDGVITDKPLLNKSLVVITCVLFGFLTHGFFHLEAGTIALAGASVLLIFENKKDIWNDVEWTTIFFFVGLFIIVGAVERAGTIEYLSELVLKSSGGSFEVLTISVLWVSAILSALIDNIPYTATMIPLIHNLGKHYQNIEPLWWSLALGACLGGNGTLIGASANIIVADMANNAKYPIRFIEFLKVGSLIVLESLVISTIYVWWRYL